MCILTVSHACADSFFVVYILLFLHTNKSTQTIRHNMVLRARARVLVSLTSPREIKGHCLFVCLFVSACVCVCARAGVVCEFKIFNDIVGRRHGPRPWRRCGLVVSSPSSSTRRVVGLRVE